MVLIYEIPKKSKTKQVMGKCVHSVTVSVWSELFTCSITQRPHKSYFSKGPLTKYKWQQENPESPTSVALVSDTLSGKDIKKVGLGPLHNLVHVLPFTSSPPRSSFNNPWLYSLGPFSSLFIIALLCFKSFHPHYILHQARDSQPLGIYTPPREAQEVTINNISREWWLKILFSRADNKTNTGESGMWKTQEYACLFFFFTSSTECDKKTSSARLSFLKVVF